MLKYLTLKNGDEPKEIDDLKPFKCVVLISEDVSVGWRASVSKWLVNSGCLYMMAWGRECSAWDDSVDKANCERFDCGDIPDGQFVMTTWHDDDSLEDVSHF